MAKLLYMIVAKETMQVLQLGALEKICAKQFLEDPTVAIDTSPVSFGGSYSCYSKAQLVTMAGHLGLVIGNETYAEIIGLIKNSLIAKYKNQEPLQSEEYYEAQIAKRRKQEPELYAQFDPVAPPPNPARARVSETGTPRAPVSAATKPAGGTTRKVWDIADSVRADNPNYDAKTLRPLIISACESQGINASTAGTQFAKWKNSQNWGSN